MKTFLEVTRTRHFGQAAENLFVSQSAVSARIRLLEESLGVRVFTRERNNIQLTPAGEKLARYAERILTTWNRARQEIAVQTEEGILLAVGGAPSLWDILLQEWLHAVHARDPHLVLTAEVHSPDQLLRRLLEGSLDLAFTFEPPQAARFAVSEVMCIPLVLVASRAGLGVEAALGEGYVLVDWGSSFADAHALHFPDLSTPRMRLGLGRMALAFLQARGGAAYLAESMVEAALSAGQLHRVEGAPVLHRTAYAVYPEAGEHRALVESLLGYFAQGGGVGTGSNTCP